MRHFLGFIVFFGLVAGAQAQEVRGGYLGAAVGSFNFKDGDFSISDTASSYRLLGGWQFNSNYAVEAGWGESGDVSETFYGFSPNGEARVDFERSYEIWSIRALTMAPFSSISIFGGAGYYDATLTSSNRFQDPAEIIVETEESTDNGATVVGGFQFDMRRITLRGEYEWFDTDGSIDATSLNFVALFRF